MNDNVNFNPILYVLFAIILIQIIIIILLLKGRKNHQNVLAIPTLLAVTPKGSLSLTCILLALIVINSAIIFYLIFSAKWVRTNKTEKWLSNGIEKLNLQEEKAKNKQENQLKKSNDVVEEIKPKLPEDDEEDDEDSFENYTGEDTIDADKISENQKRG